MPPASQSREEERRLNSRTLAIASMASATAAAVTSQLWIAGTWVAAAVTPVLVSLISEALHRPTERVARAWTAEREARGSTTRPRAQSATRGEPAAVTGSAGPVRVYRQTSRGVTEPERAGLALGGRRIPWRAVLLTAAAAFVIAIATITAVDVVSGGSVGKGSGGTTLFGGGKSHRSATNDSSGEQQRRQTPERQSTTPDQTTSETAPQAPAPQSDTAPAAPPTQSTPTATDPSSTP